MRKILKKTSPLLVVLGVILAVSVTSMGAEKKKVTKGECGKEAIWSYNKESKTLTIKGKGSIIRKGNGWITSDDEWSNLNIKEIKIKEGITNIGARAFYDLHTVKSVVIPDSVKKIEKFAFSETSITRITIGKNVKKIGKSVFANCYKLKEVNWSANTDTIPMCTFLHCRKLVDLKIKSKPKKIGSYALKGTRIKSFNMPNSVESIGKGVFASNKKLKSVNLSSKITSIPKYTFEDTPKLKKITMKEGIKVIGLGAFHASGIKNGVRNQVSFQL